MVPATCDLLKGGSARVLAFPEDLINPFAPLEEMLLIFLLIEEKQMLTTGFEIIIYMWKIWKFEIAPREL